MMRSFFILALLIFTSSAWAVERPAGAVVCAVSPEEATQKKAQIPAVAVDGEETKPSDQAEWSLGQPLVTDLHGKVMYLPAKAPAGISQVAWDRQLVYANDGGYWTLVLYYWDEKSQIWQTAIDFEGTRIVMRSLVSGPDGEEYLPLNSHPDRAHGHLGRFQVLQGKTWRNPRYVSKEWECDMPYALRYFNGHFIHAALSSVANMLGMPNSHGCTRNMHKIAAWRYGWVGPTKEYWVNVTDDEKLSEDFALQGKRKSFLP